jgi:HD superfamily phosphodiesterase
MNLTESIEFAELRFMQILEEFFIGIYDETFLPSHGIDHHRRVWNYSKELITLLPNQNINFVSDLPGKLIIASFLHDIGMSVETGVRHGIHSRDLCIRFLNQHNLSVNEYSDVLETIENHDRKDYTGDSHVSNLLNILSVADDLDAFGFIGIFRYSEIYLKREIDTGEIGTLIKENAGNRFNNYVKTFGSNNELVQKHKKRYLILDDFFNKYNSQVTLYHFGSSLPSGYCGVIEVLLEMIQKEILLRDLRVERLKYLHDPVICWFFEGLENELSSIHKEL